MAILDKYDTGYLRLNVVYVEEKAASSDVKTPRFILVMVKFNELYQFNVQISLKHKNNLNEE